LYTKNKHKEKGWIMMSETQAYIDLAKKLNIPQLISEKEFIGKTVKEIRFNFNNNHQYMISEDNYCLGLEVERSYYEDVTPVFIIPENFYADQWYWYIQEFKDRYAKTKEEADEIQNQLSDISNQIKKNRYW